MDKNTIYLHKFPFRLQIYHQWKNSSNVNIEYIYESAMTHTDELGYRIPETNL
jgi:hypothetical protein